MRLKIDRQSDALYLRLDEARIVASEEVRPGVVLDFDEDDNVVGVEILALSGRANSEALQRFEFQTV
jgi:uncharacterized protein YuzE